MADGSLTFVVPVRDHRSSDDWDGTQVRLGETVRSIARQTDGVWRCVVVAGHGAPLPAMPDGTDVVRVDLPAVTLPPYEGPARWAAVRTDKGARVMAGLLHARPPGHVMVVDYDDFVSARLAGLTASRPQAPGWYVQNGFVYDGGPVMYALEDFNGFCGTSLVVRADLLRVPDRAVDVDDALVARWLGSHQFLRDDLEKQGSPLRPTPFPGAVYRVGHRGNTSRSPGVRTMFFGGRSLMRHPVRSAARLTRLRPLTPSMRREFGIAPLTVTAASGNDTTGRRVRFK